MERALRASTRKTAWKASSAMVPVTQELSADAEDHRPVPRHQRDERRIPGRVAAGGEPLQQLPVGQTGDRATLEERLDLPDNRPRRVRHAGELARKDLVRLIPPYWIVPRRRSSYPRLGSK